MKVLVTGGAGYLGATIVSAFSDAGDDVVLLDDLSAGCPAFLAARDGYNGDVGDRSLLRRVFAEHPDIDLVVHCAARTSVPESVAEPLAFYRDNVAKTVTLLEEIARSSCRRVIFSSSAAVYGTPAGEAVDEDDEVRPETPYAVSKLTVERILDDVCATGALTGLSLRYFNPIGVDPQLRSGPHHSGIQPVLGALLRAAASGAPFRLHGRDWPTRDGTPLRDFVDAWDVASAHVAAARAWPGDDGRAHEVMNIGSGRGTTVAELAAAVNEELAEPVRIEYDARRPGDTVGSFATIKRARTQLGWEPQRSVSDSVRAALRWQAVAHSC